MTPYVTAIDGLKKIKEPKIQQFTVFLMVGFEPTTIMTPCRIVPPVKATVMMGSRTPYSAMTLLLVV